MSRSGQRNLGVTANTYSHVMLDEREVDYASLLARGASLSPAPRPPMRVARS